nr:hypothetical protein [uncultured Dysosmobacter sp.]
MDKNQGYEIQQAVLFDNGRGMAFGAHPREGFVTWQFTEEAGKRDYYWGHYHSDKATAEKEFTERGADYMRRFAVKVVQIEAPGLYKYYSTQRPVDIGTFPKPPRNAPDEIVNYEGRVPVEGGAFQAWGHLTYTRPLTDREVADYELRPAPEVAGLWREESPRPIAEQMAEAQKLAGEQRAQPGPDKNAPDRDDR